MKFFAMISGLAFGLLLLGSTPFGFSEPLRVQLEQGIETENIQCDNPNHVLVLRTNGKIACVTERTSEKFGWEILSVNQEINNIFSEEDWTLKYREMLTFDYEFPIEGINSGQSESSRFDTSVGLSIDKLPEMGDTATVTLNVTYEDDRVLKDWLSENEYSGMGITISDNFEFVSVSEGEITNFVTNAGNNKSSVSFPVDFIKGETHTLTATIKTVKEGFGNISAAALQTSRGIDLGIAPTETLLRTDYQSKYPQIQITSISEPTPIPSNGLEVTIIEFTPENLRDLLTELGYPPEMVEEEVQREFPDLSEPSMLREGDFWIINYDYSTESFPIDSLNKELRTIYGLHDHQLDPILEFDTLDRILERNSYLKYDDDYFVAENTFGLLLYGDSDSKERVLSEKLFEEITGVTNAQFHDVWSVRLIL